MVKQIMTIKAPLLLSLALVVVTALTFTVFNPPVCPIDYTQAQVDASGCVVGANIGLGIITMLVITPLTILTTVVWVLYVLGQIGAKKGSRKK